MRELWPPLSLIEERTRLGPVLAAASVSPAPDADVGEEVNVPPMPEVVAHAVTRGIPKSGQQRISSLIPGAIVLVEARSDEDGTVVQKMHHPFAFCLHRRLGNAQGAERWSGWMASPDTDYAGPYDVLLEPDDGPFDPHAGMIQTWNPLVLSVQRPARLMALLSSEQLAIMERVASEASGRTGDLAPSAPGIVGLRSVSERHSALTGTRLAKSDDPRIRYQELYRELASTFMPRAANDESWFGSHRKQFYALAATIVVAVGAALVIEQPPEQATTVAVAKPSGAPTQIAQVAPPAVPVPQAKPELAPQAIEPRGPKEGAAVERRQEPTEIPASATTKLAKVPELGRPDRKEAPAVQVPKSRQPRPSDQSPEPATGSAGKAVPLIMLASLDEARLSIPLVRSAAPALQDQTLSGPPTHILKIADREKLGDALKLLRSLGLDAAVANSPVPAVMLSFPANARLADIEEKISGSGYFLPRQSWLRTPSASGEK